MPEVLSNNLIRMNFSSADDFNLYMLGLNSKRRMCWKYINFTYLCIFNMQLGVYLLANNSTIYTRSAVVILHYLHSLAFQQVQLQK